MNRRRRSSSSSSPAMTVTAMALDELDRWLQARAELHPAATSLAMLDGHVAAIVAGPVSISPPDWICPLLAIDVDAFNHGETPEFAAISAVALWHNEISNTLSTAPDRFKPMHRQEACGAIDAQPWCQGFYAAMQLRMAAWSPLLDPGNLHHGLLRPILMHCRDNQGRPLLEAQPRKNGVSETPSDAHLGIPAAVEALRQYWMPIRYKRAR